jgi:hypothetical protein
MRVEGATSATITLSSSEGTRVPAGTVGGDGLFAGDGAHVTVDLDFATEPQMGNGSAMVANARTGILGAGIMGTTENTELIVHGVLLGSNDGPGAFFQTGAIGRSIGYARIEDNTALGLGAAAAPIFEIPCNGIVGTRMGTLVTIDEALELGDGLSLASNSSTMADVHDNEFTDNARFAAVFTGSDAMLRNNRGSGNRYGIKGYAASTVDSDGTNAIDAREAAPSDVQPTARGAVDLTNAGGP